MGREKIWDRAERHPETKASEHYPELYEERRLYKGKRALTSLFASPYLNGQARV